MFGCVRLLLGGFEEGLHSFEFREYFIVRTFVYQFLIINWCNFLLLRYLLTYLEGFLLLDNFTFDGHLGALDNGRFFSLADGLWALGFSKNFWNAWVLLQDVFVIKSVTSELLLKLFYFVFYNDLYRLVFSVRREGLLMNHFWCAGHSWLHTVGAYLRVYILGQNEVALRLWELKGGLKSPLHRIRRAYQISALGWKSY